jgi:Matrixin
MTKRLALGSAILVATTILGSGVAQAVQPWIGGCTINYTIDPSATSYERQIVRAVREISAVSDIEFVRVNKSPDITYSLAGNSGALAPKGYMVAGAYDYQNRTVWLTDIYLPGVMKRSLVLHETLHAIGLDHVDNPDSIMYPVATGTTAFSLDDLSGILKISVANNCGY